MNTIYFWISNDQNIFDLSGSQISVDNLQNIGFYSFYDNITDAMNSRDFNIREYGFVPSGADKYNILIEGVWINYSIATVLLALTNGGSPFKTYTFDVKRVITVNEARS